MPINIMTHGTRSRKVSSEEVAERIAKANDEAVIREKAQYQERSKDIRKAAEKMNFSKGVRARAVYDARTYFRHEQQNPGCMSNESYLRELRRDNPEIRLD